MAAGSTYIYYTKGTATNEKIGTFSFWVKKCENGGNRGIWQTYTGASDRCVLYWTGTDALGLYGLGTTSAVNLTTSKLFRDVGAWYHVVVAIDTTQTTDTDRVKIYVNGIQETSFSSTSYPAEDGVLKMLGSSTVEAISRDGGDDSYNFNGCLSHINRIDGTAYAASDFGETDSTSGIWKIKAGPSVTYGTNGYFLKFEDSSNMDLDSSGNALSFTTSGTLTATKDSPSNNFCTMNPLYYWGSATAYSNGNTSLITSTANKGRPATMGVQAGKWYWEVQCNVNANGCTGIVSETAATGGDLNDSTVADGFDGYVGNRAIGYEFAAGDLMDVSTTSSSWAATIGAGDVVQVALDLDNNKLYFGKNGTWQNSGDPTSGATGTGAVSITAYATLPALGDIWWFPLWHGFDTSCKGEFNFGNGYFGTTAVTSAQADDAGIGAMEYDVPAGYYCLCTKNIKAYGG